MACKQTQKVTYDPSNVTVVVRDNNGNILSGAVVRMYDEQNAYRNGKQTGSETGFVSKQVTDGNGSVSFTNLNTDKEYFFFVTYRDRAHFLDMDNSDKEFKFTKYLGKGTDSNVEIELSVSKSAVGFYAQPAIKSHLPIEISIDGDSIGSLSDTLVSVPNSLNQKGTLSYRLSQGVHTWFAVSKLGCVWLGGTIQATGTESFNPIAMEECNAGSVSFYIDTANVKNLPIKVFLSNTGQTEEIGTLGNNDYLLVAPTKFSSPKAVSVARGTGTYSYYATSLRNSNCSWQGLVTVGVNYQSIKLPKCQ